MFLLLENPTCFGAALMEAYYEIIIGDVPKNLVSLDKMFGYLEMVQLGEVC